MNSGECDCTNPMACLACLLRTQQELNESARVFRTADTVHEQCSCTAAALQHRSPVSIRRQICIDLLSLLDTITAPPENIAAIVVRTHAEPNSAPSWFGYRVQPSCVQLLFFDTRRPQRSLMRGLADALFLNHTVAHTSLPQFSQKVPNKCVALCACKKPLCPGTVQRAQKYQQRVGAKAVVGGSAALHHRGKGSLLLLSPPNDCTLTTTAFDRFSPLALPLMMFKAWDTIHDIRMLGGQYETLSEESRRCIDAHEVVVASIYEFWNIYDTRSGLPLLHDAHADNIDDEHLPRCAQSDDELLMCSYCQEQCEELKKKRAADTKVSPSVLAPNLLRELGSINVDEVRRVYKESTHTTPMCALRIAEQLHEPALVTFLCASKRMFAPTEDSGDKQQTSGDFTESVNVLIEETLQRVGRAERAHPVECACLFEQFIATRCTKQLNLSLVPVPVNPLLTETCGDAIFDIRSPSMRELATQQTADMLIARGEMPYEAIDWDAERGAMKHFDTAIARYACLRDVLHNRFGGFSFRFDRSLQGFVFHPTDGAASPQHCSDTAFADYCARNIVKCGARSAASKIADKRLAESVYESAHTATLAKLSYDQILAESKRMFGVDTPRVSEAKTLIEILLYRGLLENSALIRAHWHWLPPAAAYVIEQALAVPQQNVAYAQQIIGHESGEHYVLSEAIERAIIDDLKLSANRRLVMARLSSCFLTNVRTKAVFADNVLCMTAALLLIVQCDELARRLYEKRVAVQPASTQVVVVVEEKKHVQKPKKQKSVEKRLATQISPPLSPPTAKMAKPTPTVAVVSEKPKPKSKKKAVPPKAVSESDVGEWSVVEARGKVRRAQEPAAVPRPEPILEEIELPNEIGVGTPLLPVDAAVYFDFLSDPEWFSCTASAKRQPNEIWV